MGHEEAMRAAYLRNVPVAYETNAYNRNGLSEGKRDYFFVLIETSMYFVTPTHTLFIFSNPQFSMLLSMQRTFHVILCGELLLVPPHQPESQHGC